MSIDITKALRDHNRKYINSYSVDKTYKDVNRVFYFKNKPSKPGGPYKATDQTIDVGIVEATSITSPDITVADKYDAKKEMYPLWFGLTSEHTIVHTYEFDGTNIYHVVDIYNLNCFPFDAIATTPTGKKRCEELVLGEEVLVDHKGTFEPILCFSHRADHSSLYVELTLENDKKMSTTPQHYIFTFNKRKKGNGFYERYCQRRFR